ncbi:MAG: hypothetical protein OHK0038_09790 [Flammeovirgaceae bacterium]
MTVKKYLVKILCIIALFIHKTHTFSQGFIDKPRKSPIGIANYKEDSLYIKITYGRPRLKNDLALPFGINTKIAQHPYGKIWRTGEDDATEIIITKPVIFCGTPLKAGIYTIFTIPDSLEWTVILNKEVGMWGTYQYKPENDVLKVKVPAYRSPKVFMDFSIFFQKSEEGVDIVMIWGRDAIRLPLFF